MREGTHTARAAAFAVAALALFTVAGGCGSRDTDAAPGGGPATATPPGLAPNGGSTPPPNMPGGGGAGPPGATQVSPGKAP